VATDLWATDRPILEAIAEADANRPPSTTDMNLEKVCADAGIKIARDQLIKSLVRLTDAGYLNVTFNRGGGGVLSYWFRGVPTAGLRESNQWPSDADAYQILLQVLEERAEAAPDEHTRGRFRATLNALGAMGRELFVDVMGEVISKKMG
jgi:hypothetical protein